MNGLNTIDTSTINMQLCFEDLLYFALRNRGTVFADLQPLQIASELWQGLQTNCLWYSQEQNEITGLVLFDKDGSKKEIFVKALVSTTSQPLRDFVKRGFAEFPGFTIGAFRHGSRKQIDLTKLNRKVSYGRL
jgi:hypothetical protein